MILNTAWTLTVSRPYARWASTGHQRHYQLSRLIDSPLCEDLWWLYMEEAPRPAIDLLRGGIR
jgi:hypothetical protein